MPQPQLNQQPIPNPFLNPNLFYNSFQAAAMVPPAVATTTAPSFQQNPTNYSASQQVVMQAWMQQAYVQYINQYMNMLQLGAQSTPLYASATPGTNFPNYAYLPSPSTGQTGMPQVAATPHSPQQQNQVGVAAAANAQAPGGVVGAAPPVAAENQPQRRFPNIVVEEAQDNRDWLDISFTTLRVAVLLSLIYFYSSPLRCLAVLFVGIALFLYRRGVFRNQIERNLNELRQNNQRQQQQQNNNNNNNGEDNAQPALGNIEGDATTGAAQDPNRPSMLATIRTFIFSFIFSLIPETPAL